MFSSEFMAVGNTKHITAEDYYLISSQSLSAHQQKHYWCLGRLSGASIKNHDGHKACSTEPIDYGRNDDILKPGSLNDNDDYI